MTLEIQADTPTTSDVVQLLEAHLELMRATSPPDHIHALDLDGLMAAEISFFTARDDGLLLGVGALRGLGEGRAELKSMHTAQAARGRGVGRMMLDHLIATAQNKGVRWLGLETGTMAEFAPARRLYLAAGFIECEPFDQYTDNAYSTCMSMSLADA